VCRTARPTTTCSVAVTSYCMAPCQSNADCPVDQSCSQGACYGMYCANPAAMCPAYTQCRGAMWSAWCTGNSCTTDGECPGAYCVNGTCQSELGFCASSCD
jgi:hypothetical protein